MVANATPSTEERLAESGLLYNLGKSLSAVLNLPELLTRVIEAAVMLAHASDGVILLPDPDSGVLRTQAAHAAGGRAAQVVNQPTEDLIASKVMAQDQPIMLQPGDSLPAPYSRRTADRSLLYVPLTSQGRMVGALGVMRPPDEPPFSRHELDMLAGLGGYAAIALENARLYSQAVDRTRELSLLVESGSALSWSLDLGQVLNAVARQMTRGLQAHWCVISAWNADTEEITTLAEYRLAAWPKGGAPSQPVDEWPAYRRAITDSAYVSLASGDPLVAARRCGRLLVIPLQHGGKVVGLVELACLHNHEPHRPDEIRRALRHAFPFAAILDEPDSSAISERMIGAARALISASEASWCAVYRLDAAAGTLMRALDYGAGVWVEASGPALSITELPTPSVALHEQRIAVLRSSGPDLRPAELALFSDVPRGALLLLPLVFKARTVGLVQLYDLSPDRQFSAREMGLAHALANQAAIALENARLVRDLQESLDDQRAMQSHLVRAARLSAVGEMAMVIAHQINNPLTTILADAEMLTQDTQPDTVLRESAEAIQRAGKRAKRVVERMLLMGRQETKPIAIDVKESILETLELVGGQIRQERIVINLNLADGLPPTLAPPGHLEDVWMNLLINARDAIVESRADRGVVTVASRLRANRSALEVTVKDNGAGINEGDLDRIFDPLFTTKPAGRGTGLGLYICQQIVSALGGDLTVASKPGRGARVKVSLPVWIEEQDKPNG